MMQCLVGGIMYNLGGGGWGVILPLPRLPVGFPLITQKW